MLFAFAASAAPKAATLSLPTAPSVESSVEFELPADDEVLQRTGFASATPGPEIRFLVWNVHKTTGGKEWVRDFGRLAAESDVALIQEGHLTPAMNEAIQFNRGFQWFFAVAFFYKGAGTGVLSSSRWPTENVAWHRSPDREPVLKTPKMALEMTIPLADGRRLLVVNVHGINFVTNAAFKRQILPLAARVKKHDGPVVFAGDFNTWNGVRLGFLHARMRDAGLLRIPLLNDSRRLKLDHVYMRGMTLVSAVLRDDVESSDHSPIQATFKTVPLARRVPLR